LKIRIKASPFSDVKAGEFAEVVERRYEGDPFMETWLLQVLPATKAQHCSRCGAPARRHWFKLHDLELAA
jgi:hypothetical protein